MFHRLRHTPATDAPLLRREEILDLRARVHAAVANETTRDDTRHDTSHPRMGDARSLYKGSGLDYEESRPYQPGDDLRRMNWRLTARTGQPAVKVFREERRPGVFVLVDRRAAMRFGTRARLKVTQAARACACVAFAAQLRHAALGGVMVEAAPRWLREDGGEGAAFALTDAACAPCPPVTANTEPALAHILRLAQELLVPGSRVYLLSDFHDLAEEHRAALLQLAAQHTVHAVQIFDPAEQALPAAGTLRLSTPSVLSQEEAREVDTVTAADAYHAAAAEHFERCKTLFQSLGLSHTLLSTEEEAVEKRLPL